MRAVAFYRRLGFDEMLFESTDFFDPMAPWYDRELPEQHMVMMMSAQGGGIEPCRLTPLGPDCRGEWGHLGPMEFASAYRTSSARAIGCARRASSVRGAPQTVDVGPASGATPTSSTPTGSTSRSSSLVSEATGP